MALYRMQGTGLQEPSCRSRGDLKNYVKMMDTASAKWHIIMLDSIIVECSQESVAKVSKWEDFCIFLQVSQPNVHTAPHPGSRIIVESLHGEPEH